MARNQKLINYHTGKKTAMPELNEVDYGEIVVRHNEETPELLIKVSDSSFGVFQASGAVKTAIGDAKVEIYNSATTFATNAVNAAKKELNSAINAVASNVETLSGAVSSITENYVTKTDFEIAQGKLFNSATTVASNDATTKANKAKEDAITAAAASATTLLGLVDAVNERVDTVSGNLNTFKTDVANTYETKTGVTNAITAAKDSVYSSATTAAAADAKTKADTAYSSATTAAAASAETLNNSIEAVDGKVGTLSGNVHTRIEGLKTELTNTINEKVATAYRFQGSCTYAELASKEKVNGYVWNVTDAHGNVPAGTNYAWSEEENKWDALGGIVDLSPYATITYVDGEIDKIEQIDVKLRSDIDSLSSATKTLIDEVSAATKATYATKTELEAASGSIITAYTNAIATTNSNLSTLSGSVDSFSATVVNDYATKVIASGYAMTAEANAVSSGKGYTDGQINAVTTAYTQADKDLDARIDKLEAISADTQSAVQNVVVDNTNANKITATKTVENNVVTLNFDSMVIDCGEF